MGGSGETSQTRSCPSRWSTTLNALATSTSFNFVFLLALQLELEAQRVSHCPETEGRQASPVQQPAVSRTFTAASASCMDCGNFGRIRRRFFGGDRPVILPYLISKAGNFRLIALDSITMAFSWHHT